MGKISLRASCRAVLISAAAVVVMLALSLEAGAAGLTKIDDNVYSYVDTKKSSPANSFGANAGIIIGEKGVVVVDTLMSAKQAKKFIKDIKAVTRKPIKYVINTHSHLDHTFGNYEFAKRGAVIVAQKNCLTNMMKSSEATLKNAKNFGLTPKDLKGTKIAYPTLTFTDRMDIDLGNQVVELFNTGHSHTDDSLIVYLPGSKILFAGDVLFTGYHPFIADGDIPEWTRALDNIMLMDVERIIPGHGPLSTKRDIEDMKKYLIAFDQKAKELATGSKDAGYIASQIIKALPSRLEGAGLVQWNVQKYLKK